ncbi:error-prone DNA polymerase [Emcibacter sp. SYSU 3D8]|uniref:error-prone DNA polymerase n=1 Tax=Emcibacter sp. SYSU 3D8 TaxID=3133969 RepID=UPI0031FE5154
MTAYAELQITSNFSFLRGGSHPEELVGQAAALGMEGVSIADRNTLAGVVRAHRAAKEIHKETGTRIRLAVGARLDLTDAPSVLCYPRNRSGYARLARLITRGRRAAPKGDCWLSRADVLEAAEDNLFIAVPPVVLDEGYGAELGAWRDGLKAPLYLAATHYYRGDDAKRLERLETLAARFGAPLVATGDIHYHDPARRRLQDVLTCIREHCTIATAGWRLAANAERHLKPPEEMGRLFRQHPEAVRRTMEVLEQCCFSLDELRYEYPDEITENGRNPQEELENLAWKGAAWRYPGGIPDTVKKSINDELKLIAYKDYAPYFLTVNDVVRFARGKGILCQGRGSAANSVVCYCLGITSVDPTIVDLLFERFVSADRNEPPDIDVDFEHERREEVMQYIYEKYGRERAGIVATVICYRSKGAIRDVAKAMGLSTDLIDKLSQTITWWSGPLDGDRAREEGLDPADRTLMLALTLAAELRGFPRHLSQHTGGFVISRGPLCEVVPIENAAMEGRTVIEWNKDDLEELGLIKVDVLALGMLTAIRKTFEFIRRYHGQVFDLATIPQEDQDVYGMIQKADTVGVFQIESRAQMAMLPRLKPATYYDLVIEVAIVRPGPIQGDMVHPYLRRRKGLEPVAFPKPELEEVLRRTLGVPLFQEQAMKIAIVAAGFSPSRADKLRRAMATFRHLGTIDQFRDEFIEGMVARDYEREFAERCFSQIEGFGDYGFPESHAASFALLAYVSSWLKYHYPEAFTAGLLNSYPMGFYAPAQLVRDLRDHNGAVRPADVNLSDWDCTLEPVDGQRPALRLGLRQIKGLAAREAEKLMAYRGSGYRSPLDLWQKAGLTPRALERLAEADAFQSLGLDRRQAAWAVKRLSEAKPLPLFEALDHGGVVEQESHLPGMGLGEHVVADYQTTQLSLKQHPVALLRERLSAAGARPTRALATARNGSRIIVAGVVLARQRPGTAKDVMFITLEDETGVANLVVFPGVYEKYRRETLTSRLMACEGKVESADNVIHLIVEKVHEINGWLTLLTDRPEDAPEAFLDKGRFFH